MTPFSAPYLHRPVGIRRSMNLVLIALLPGILIYLALIAPALIAQIAIASVSALVFEALLLYWRDEPVHERLNDYSALVAAWLIALTFPPLSPWWLTVIGVFFAIVIAKQLYGGLGQNPFNPAMVAFAVCIVAFPALMSRWPVQGLTLPFTGQMEIIFGLAPHLDALTSATPLDAIRTALRMEIQYDSVQELLTRQNLYGTFAGRGWEWVTAAYLGGGIFLLIMGVITWHIPLAFITGMSAIALIGWLVDPSRFADPIFHLFSGGSMLGAFFIATDPVSGCATPRGKLIFGAGAGCLAYLIRVFGSFPDGIAFAVLIMNLAAPLLDLYCQPKVFGALPSMPVKKDGTAETKEEKSP
ncbi:MAG: RnfABCDGE type electron transport complex subunit D [Zoogloeaceae bacterium]|jgi:electron transport complex protein RnfD|nr:RnfABCDGE type electron transport complex subunit D [Zoogloeaceae bacterium]